MLQRPPGQASVGPLGSHDQGRASQSGQEDAVSWPCALSHLQESLSLENQGQSRGSQDQSAEASSPGQPVTHRRDAGQQHGAVSAESPEAPAGTRAGPNRSPSFPPPRQVTRSKFVNYLAADLGSGDEARMGARALLQTVNTGFSGALRNA